MENMKRSDVRPSFLSGQKEFVNKRIGECAAQYEFPEDCLVDFDLRLIELYREIGKSRNREERLENKRTGLE